MNAKEKITKARAGLILDQPFFGSLALRLIVKEDPSCPTAWTDGQTLGYNPAFIEARSLDEVKGILAHEVLHNSNGHHVRRQNRDSRNWNIATDGAVNEILKGAGFVLPPGCIDQPQWQGLSSEDRYSRLPKPQPQGQNGQGGQGGQGQGQGKPPDAWNIGEVRDYTNADGTAPTQGELDRQAENWKIATAQAANAAKRAGKLPGSLARMVEDVINPPLPWREILRRFIELTARNDYNWMRPNRRFIGQGLYLPSCISEEMRPLVIVMDTSGSTWCEPALIEQFAKEISVIVEDCKASVTLIYADDGVQKVEEFKPEDMPLKIRVMGGGGTDFRPAFNWVEKRGLDCAALIYLTDLEGDFPESAPTFPVLWVTNPQGKDKRVPFGDKLIMAQGQKGRLIR